MKGKRGSVHLLVLFLFIAILSNNVHATAVTDCNNAGGIWCGNEAGGSCVGQGSALLGFVIMDVNYDGICNIAVDQEVILDPTSMWGLNQNNLRSFTFKEFRVLGSKKIQFYNSVYGALNSPKASDATCADTTKTCAEGGANRYHFPCYGGIPLAANEFTASKGGAGGTGARDSKAGDDYWGGGGGAGAGGGIIGAAGGDGHKFSSSSEYSGGSGTPGDHDVFCAGSGQIGTGGENGGRGGGFVKISANVIEIQDGASISVNGENGKDGNKGGDRENYGGYGGGPGAGGGGAGKLILSYITLKGKGQLTAKGGDGGKGGAGGKSTRQPSDAGAGGGGGGGAGGIIGLVPGAGGSADYTVDISCGKGLGGAGGPQNEEGGAGKNGADGPEGLCKTTEMDPGQTGDDTLAFCSDTLDNNKNGAVDMDDISCRTTSKWDASIYETYLDKTAIGFEKSARNAKDLACGDDLGTCVAGASTTGTCISNGGNLCSTKYCVIINEVDYACGCEEGDYPEACKEVDQGEQRIYNPYLPGDNKYEYRNTATCEMVDNFCQSNAQTEEECQAYSDICSWQTNINPSCTKIASEPDCKKQAGCNWQPAPEGTADLGAVTSDGQYLCLNSIDESGAVVDPGHFYSWFDAEGSVQKRVSKPGKLEEEYQIMQADKTQFISNKDQWFQCNANTQGPQYSPKKIVEFKTFPPSSREQSMLCSTVLEKAMDTTILDCDLRDSDCWQLCNTDDCKGYCKTKSYTQGTYIQTCGEACFVKVGTEHETLEAYSSTISEAICQSANEGCSRMPPGIKAGGNSEYKNQDYCKIYGAVCGGKDINVALDTCQSAHKGLNYVYNEQVDAISGSNKLCSKTQYCQNGQFIQTKEYLDSNGDQTCCLGQDAYCKEYDVRKCEDIGGNLKPEMCSTTECECSSAIVRDNCCLSGKWQTRSELGLGINDSFICYKEAGANLIQECCGINTCLNENNILNNNDYTLSRTVYSLEGVPLHSIMTFDTVKDDVPEKRVKTFYDRRTGARIELFDYMSNQKNMPYKVDWSTFNYLDFDILYNTPNITYNLAIEDASGKVCIFNISEYLSIIKGPLRWQHATIPLAGLSTCTASFDAAAINDIEIRLDGKSGIMGINVLLDNFYLRTAGNAENSENKFCSGNWGDWVTNLDGPASDKGFFDASNEDKENLSKYGPYRDACEGVVSYGWTGSACCGDDTTRGAYGEYWKDTNGACWNGTTVTPDTTVADALGLSPMLPGWDSAQNERHLLFYDGKLMSCNWSLSHYDGLKISYSGKTLDGDLKVDNNIIEPYSIRGNWMCMNDSGWVKLDDVSRARIIAATLKSIAVKEKKDYTLYCGAFNTVVNTLGNMNSEEEALTDYACVLRMGGADIKDTDKVIIGLEASRDNPYGFYKTGVLNAFPTMRLPADASDKCDSIESDVDADDLFQECAANEDSIRVYYNKGLNMVLLSDFSVQSEVVSSNLGFAANLWSKFRDFFAGLFGSQTELGLSTFEQDIRAKDFFISVQGQKRIEGLLQKSSQFTFVRIDYHYLTTSSVELIANASRSNFAHSTVNYAKNGEVQTVYINSTEPIDWRLLTSVLRLSSQITTT